MITGPLKVVVIGPPGSGKTQLADAIANAVKARGATVAIYDGDNIAGPSKAAVVVMTVQCSAEQFDDPAELLRGYQARSGKL